MSWSRLRNCLVMCLPLAGLLIGCSGSQQGQIEDAEYIEEHEHGNEGGVLALPELSPVDLNGRKLRVVATTSIIGDVVAQVGGEAIELTTLMEPGQDPHSYEPGARELTAVADADVIFINGWDLEESLARDLENIGESVTVVPVSANIEPLAMTPNPKGIAGADPHVWMSIHNVERWTENISAVLSDLDAANAAIYAANVASYQVQLADLDAYAQEQLAAIPADRRVLVANHRAFSYFARDYELEMLGTVIPGFSSLAEPSADDLTDLIGKMENRGVCTIFTETAVGDQLAQVVAGELNFCDQVQVLPLYTGSLGPTDSPANTYIGMMRFNIDAIAQGLNMID
ncbi:MAG: zinc ABC transporter solute-binding protein [Chloroflexi bacterium]|nr:zinc ABC transporter solute-binding protein [Chloroflexota bacterium]